MPNSHPLDNPIWNALNTEHSELALGNKLAKRYPTEIGPLSGIADEVAANYEALRLLANPGGAVVLFLDEPHTSKPGWTLVRVGLLSQMILMSPTSQEPSVRRTHITSRKLTPEDVPAMLELATLTEPGPFRQRTIELGEFHGIFDSGRLVSMAGQRLHLNHFVEISAVCTHPDARGRGYARSLMSLVVEEILQRAKIPFLHSFADNYPAIRVYESLGFTLRRTLNLAVIKNEAEA